MNSLTGYLNIQYTANVLHTFYECILLNYKTIVIIIPGK